MITHSPIVFDDLRPAPAKARARKSDPVESHDAAKRVELGKAERQRILIKQWLTKYGPMTCAEIGLVYNDGAGWIGKIDAGKRINEIEGIATTGESRNGSRVWSIV